MILVPKFLKVWRWIVAHLSLKQSFQVATETAHTQSQLIGQLATKTDQLHERLKESEKTAVDLQLDRLGQEKEILERACTDLRQQLSEALKETIEVRGELNGTLSEMRETIANEETLQRHLRSIQSRVNQALKLEGQIWTQPTLPGTPAFRDLSERRTPIVSVLNLKGGVGKTTSTAYWTAAGARRGMRTLLVDFDLQGSLSSLFVNESELARRDREGRLLLRHFLEAATRSVETPFLDFASPIFDGRSALVGTTDRLAYSEINLTFRWMMRAGRPGQRWDGGDDVRFLIRRGLHQEAVSEHFDMVLLDCPPLINLSCVNALAASDYVLIPVNPSRKAVERIPPLLRRLREIKQSLHPELKVLGMLAVRTNNAKGLTAPERDMFAATKNLARDAWGEPVELFDAFIPNRASIRDAEESFGGGKECADIQSAFERLADEAARRMPAYVRPNCHRPAEYAKS